MCAVLKKKMGIILLQNEINIILATTIQIINAHEDSIVCEVYYSVFERATHALEKWVQNEINIFPFTAYNLQRTKAPTLTLTLTFNSIPIRNFQLPKLLRFDYNSSVSREQVF